MASAENRLKSYKTKGLDVTEVRRRREEEGVQLRRSKREEQVRTYVYTCTHMQYPQTIHVYTRVPFTNITFIFFPHVCMTTKLFQYSKRRNLIDLPEADTAENTLPEVSHTLRVHKYLRRMF